MNILILAPHMDDSMLCLGGWLLQNKHNNVDIITIFNTAWSCIDLDMEKLNDINKCENEKVFERIKCRLEYWDYPEALARGYRNWNDVIDNEKDTNLYNLIYERLDKIFSTNYYSAVFFPMAIGKHVDHILVFNIINELLKTNTYTSSFYLYEDMPYAYYVDVSQYLSEITKYFELEEHLFDVSAEVKIKKELLSIYKSQITKKDIEVTSLYAQSIRPQKYIERVWEIEQVRDIKL